LGFKDRSEHWNPRNLGYRFLAEAKRLWELALNEKNSLTTIQAALVINIIMNMYSLDKVGMTYAVKAVAMSHELELFTPHTHSNGTASQQSYGFTAWSVFWWTR
jgi:hypothetical protein